MGETAGVQKRGGTVLNKTAMAGAAARGMPRPARPVPPMPAGRPPSAQAEPPLAPSLAKVSGSMAIATLVSRITGLAAKLMLTAVVGINVVSDSYNIANTLPNVIYELVLGGVLTSVIVPVLVRAQKEDVDGGLRYEQRLVTMTAVGLGGATVLATVAAPVLTALFVNHSPTANPQLATAFGYLLLPEIVFYALAALFSAILNTRGVFGLPAWAPVWNNVLTFAVLGMYWLVPGELSTDPVRMGDTKLLVLGIGTTLGIVAQAVVVIPALQRTGFRFQWNFGWDRRFSEFGGLALWTMGYVVVSQIGYVVTTRVATAAPEGSFTAYTLAWLLLQMPYGILGVSVLTALLPRMSSSAADGDVPSLVEDFSLGCRLSAITLLPVSAAVTVLGQLFAHAVFSTGRTTPQAANMLGVTLAVSAFLLLPFAIVMLQLRVFYALKDARTPTVINGIIVGSRVPMLLLCPVLLPSDLIVVGLAVANGLSFVVGAIVGQVWLHVRLGTLGTGRILRATGVAAVAALCSTAAMVLTKVVLRHVVTTDPSHSASVAWFETVTVLVLGGVTLIGAFLLFRVSEVEQLLRSLRAATGSQRTTFPYPRRGASPRE